jgi:hypothetical protein
MAVALLVAVAFYYSLWESPESRARTVLERVAKSMHRGPGETQAAWRRRLQVGFERDLAPSVRLAVPELGNVEGRERLLELAVETDGLFEVELETPTIQLESQRARARLSLTIIYHSPGSERREARGASVELVSDGRAFRLQSIEVERAVREQPEARP